MLLPADDLDALPFQVYQVSGLEPRYTFVAKWPVELAKFLDLGAFGNLGVDLAVNLGLVYAPRSGQWELWLGDAKPVRSDWRPRGLAENAGGFYIAGSKLSLDTRAFARGQASHLGFGFNQLNVQATLNFNQRLGEACLTDFIPGTAPSVRAIGAVLETAGFDFNSLQCVRFDLDIYGTLRLAATAPAASHANNGRTAIESPLSHGGHRPHAGGRRRPRPAARLLSRGVDVRGRERSLATSAARIFTTLQALRSRIARSHHNRGRIGGQRS